MSSTGETENLDGEREVEAHAAASDEVSLDDMDLNKLILEQVPRDFKAFVGKEAPGLAKKAEELSEAMESRSAKYIELAANMIGSPEDREEIKADIKSRWEIHVASVYKSLPKVLKEGNNFEKMGAALTFIDDMMEGLDDFSYSMREAYPQWAMLDKTLRTQEAAQMVGIYGLVQGVVKGLAVVGKTLTKYGQGSNKWIALIDAFVEVGSSIIKKVRRMIGAGATKSVKALYEGMGGSHAKGLEQLTEALSAVEEWGGATAAQKAKLFSKKVSKLSPELAKTLGEAINGKAAGEVMAIYEIVEGAKGKNAEIVIAAKLAARAQGLSEEKTAILMSVMEEKDVAKGLRNASPEIVGELTSTLSTSLAEGLSEENKKAMIAIKEVFAKAHDASKDGKPVDAVVAKAVGDRFMCLAPDDASLLVKALQEKDMSKGLEQISPAMMSKISESMTTSVEVKELFGVVSAAKEGGKDLDAVIAGEVGKRFLGLDSEKQKLLKSALQAEDLSSGLKQLTPDVVKELGVGMSNVSAFKKVHAKVQEAKEKGKNVEEVIADEILNRFDKLDVAKVDALSSALQEPDMESGLKKLSDSAMEGLTSKLANSEGVQKSKAELTSAVMEILGSLKHVQREHEKMEEALFKQQLSELGSEVIGAKAAGQDASGKAETQEVKRPNKVTKVSKRKELYALRKKSLAENARKIMARKLGIKVAANVEKSSAHSR